jgi:hypothetical protein
LKLKLNPEAKKKLNIKEQCDEMQCNAMQCKVQEQEQEQEQEKEQEQEQELASRSQLTCNTS